MDIIINNYDKLINKNFSLEITWAMPVFKDIIRKDKILKTVNNKGVIYKNEIFEGYYNIKLFEIVQQKSKERNNINTIIRKNIECNIELIINNTNKIILDLKENDDDGLYYYISTNKIISNELIKNQYLKKLELNKEASYCYWHYWWYNIHWLAINYPKIANEDNKNDIKEFMIKLTEPTGLGCPTCRNHLKKYLTENDIIKDLDSQESFLKYTVDLHNDVNKRYNKKLFSVEEAIKKYNKKWIEEKSLSKYGGDILLFFEKRELLEFVLLYNKSRRILFKDKNIDYRSISHSIERKKNLENYIYNYGNPKVKVLDNIPRQLQNIKNNYNPRKIVQKRNIKQNANLIKNENYSTNLKKSNIKNTNTSDIMKILNDPSKDIGDIIKAKNKINNK